MLRWLCNYNLNNVCLHGGPDSVWPYLTYREISEYSSPIRSADQRLRAGENSSRKLKNFLDTQYSYHRSWPFLCDSNITLFESWIQLGFLVFHKILLAPLLLRYSLLVTFCVKIYEIITREPILWRSRPGSLGSNVPGSPRALGPDTMSRRCVILLRHYYDINPLQR